MIGFGDSMWNLSPSHNKSQIVNVFTTDNKLGG